MGQPEEQARVDALRALLAQRAIDRGLLTDEADEEATVAAIEALLDREAPTPEPTEEECSRYYAKHLEQFTIGELARTLSNCPSGRHDGNLGQLTRGECAPEFEQALFSGNGTGLLPGVVRTRFGFHVVVVDRRVPGRTVPFEAVKDRVAGHLRERVQHKALEQYLRILAAETGLALPGVAPATSPLVR